MQRPIVRPFRPSRGPVCASHPHLLCRTFIPVTRPDTATFPKADSLVSVVAPSEFSHNRLPQKAAQIITRLFGFAMALSDCCPFALSQPATAVSELNRLSTSRPPTAGRTGSMAGSIWYGSAMSGGQGAIRRPTGCSHAQRISLKRNLRGASQGFAAFCTHALDLSWKKSVCE